MREDLKIKEEREALSRLQARVTADHRVLKRLDIRYQSVIRELRNQLKWWQQNAWKATFVSLYNRVKSFLERR